MTENEPRTVSTKWVRCFSNESILHESIKKAHHFCGSGFSIQQLWYQWSAYKNREVCCGKIELKLYCASSKSHVRSKQWTHSYSELWEDHSGIVKTHFNCHLIHHISFNGVHCRRTFWIISSKKCPKCNSIRSAFHNISASRGVRQLIVVQNDILKIYSLHLITIWVDQVKNIHISYIWC